MTGGRVGKRHQHQFVAIPHAFEHFWVLVRRQQSFAEFAELVEQPGLIAITGGTVVHFQLRDDIDGHLQISPRLLLGAAFILKPRFIHGAFTSPTLI